MTKPPPIIDAEFEIIEPLWKAVSGPVSTIIAAVIVFAVGFYFAVQTTGHASTIPKVIAGTAFAGGVRAGLSLFRVLRARRAARTSSGSRRLEVQKRLR